MALSSRHGRVSASIWPGFVDAMTALLLVLMFVLTIFMVVQFVLRETISGQAQELDTLNAQIAQLGDALGLERSRAAALENEVSSLNATVARQRDTATAQASQIAALSSQLGQRQAALDAAKAQITDFEAQVAALIAERDTARGEGARLAASVDELQKARTELMSQQEALNLALAKARDEIDAQTETARLAAARREALEALIADLKSQASTRETSLADALARLDRGKADAAALSTRIAELESQASARETSLADALARLDQGKTDAAALSARIAELEQGQADRDALSQRVSALEADLTDAEKARLTEAATAEALRQRLAGKDAELSQAEKARLAEAAAAEALRQRLAGKDAELSQAEKDKLAEVAAAEALREKLKNAQDELTAMTLALEAQRKKAEDTLTLLAGAEAANKDLDSKLAAALIDADTLRQSVGSEAELRDTLAAALAAKLAAEQGQQAAMSEAEQRATLLAAANTALTTEKAASAEARRKVALLNEQIAALRAQLGGLQQILDDSAARDADSQVQIEALGSRLNAALAQVASEEKKRAALEEAERKRLEEEARRLEAEKNNLETYRSEFFGRLRQVLGDREGVRIVGDRFVFSSEVLFAPGKANLSDAGKAQIARVASILEEVAGDIPPEIDWVIRVDGHTDKTQLGPTSPFRDNWELSTARALSVVHYMIDQLGFPADRLAATGFGEYSPVAAGDSQEALAANRRIELKLTEK